MTPTKAPPPPPMAPPMMAPSATQIIPTMQPLSELEDEELEDEELVEEVRGVLDVVDVVRLGVLVVLVEEGL